MAIWVILDYVEATGRNPIREWTDELPWEDQAKIDFRLLQMAAMRQWPEKWISKYRTTDLYELRVTGNRVQYRPFGTYHGRMTFVLLGGAIEKGGKIPNGAIESAQRRFENLKRGQANVVLHEFGAEGDLEEDE